LTLLLLLVANLAFSQSSKNQEPGIRNPEPGTTCRMAFYNVENLFDTVDDPAINDADFLPDSRIPWTTERYEVKLDHLGQVIGDLSDPRPIAIIGLCEVENKAVLNDLVKSPAVLKYQYKFIHRDSPDERGIDNALLYDPNQFQPVTVRSIFVDLEVQPEDLTRDILYVKGFSKRTKGDTLHIFVNHWPSRSEGQEASAPKRIRAAEVLKQVTDSILNVNPLSLIVIMGDLNDEPSDKSVAEALKALPPSDSFDNKQLYNLMEPLYREGKGTLYYKDWDLFDQVILSGYFWNKEKGLVYSGKQANILSADYLLFTSKEGVARPNRTAAKDYYGGYSDHLPVYIDLQLKK
jgi:endonuclease/exonuclease/phosphatase family metal-dependent hydrolase